MHVDVTRMLVKWLEHDQYGVNALAAELPRLTGELDEDNDPIEDPAPAAVTVFSDLTPEINHTEGLRPPKMPCIVVIVDANPKTVDIGKRGKPAHEISAAVGIGFYAEQTDIERDIITGDYILRALKQSLTLFNEPHLSRDYRELNKIQLTKVESIETQRVASAVPESHMLGILFADLLVLDKLPSP